jgi:hypothetical protein
MARSSRGSWPVVGNWWIRSRVVTSPWDGFSTGVIYPSHFLPVDVHLKSQLRKFNGELWQMPRQYTIPKTLGPALVTFNAPNLAGRAASLHLGMRSLLSGLGAVDHS